MKKSLNLKKEVVSNLTQELLKHSVSGIENIKGGAGQRSIHTVNDPVRLMYSTKGGNTGNIIIKPIIINPIGGIIKPVFP